MQSVSMANHCRQPFHVIFWRWCWCRCWRCRTIVKHILPKIQFTFPTVHKTVHAIWVGWRKGKGSGGEGTGNGMLNTSFRFRRVYAVGERHDTLLSWHIFFLSFVACIGRRTTLAWSSSTHVCRSIRWRFYCAYNSIGNLWWCDVDNDNGGATMMNLFNGVGNSRGCLRLLQTDYCNAYKINQYCCYCILHVFTHYLSLSFSLPLTYSLLPGFPHSLCHHLMRKFSEMFASLR